MPPAPDKEPGGKGQTQNAIQSSPLWDDLAGLSPGTVVGHSGASLSFQDGHPVYTVRFLGADFQADKGRRLISAPPGREGLEQAGIVILSYLVRSARGPAPGLSGVEASPVQIQSGAIFFKGPHELMKEPVARAYGESPGEFVQAGLDLGGAPHIGCSFRLRALPYAEVYCYLAPGDDEFPPEARYNFDSNIHYYLQLDGIFAMVNCLGTLLVSMKNR